MTLPAPRHRAPGLRLPLVAATAALCAALGGCVVAPARGYYGDAVYVDPPAPRAEVIGVAPYPGASWINGYWGWRGGGHAWVPGYWERPRPGYHWRQHGWDRDRDGRGWRERPGRWDRD